MTEDRTSILYRRTVCSFRKTPDVEISSSWWARVTQAPGGIPGTRQGRGIMGRKLQEIEGKKDMKIAEREKEQKGYIK